MYEFKTKKEAFARGFLNCDSESKAKRTAAGIYLSQKESPLSIDRNGLPVCRWEECFHFFTYGSGVCFEEWRFDSYMREHPEMQSEVEEYKRIQELMRPYLTTDDFIDLDPLFTEQQQLLRDESAAYSASWLGHSVPDFQGIFLHGTDYYREKVEKYRSLNSTKEGFDNAFYDAMILILDAIDITGKRLTEVAANELRTATDPERIEMLENIIKTFDHAPKQPCRDFVEACIVYVMVSSLDGTDSPGHIDQFFYDLWKITDPAARRKALEHLWEYFHDERVWNVCLSGSDENGNDLTNDLTYEILDLIKTYKYHTPNVTLRRHKGTPEKLIKATYEALKAGTGLPGLYNDDAVVTALDRLGIPKADAHTYVMNGCNQIDIPGKSHMGLEDGQINIARAVEFALHNGVSAVSGKEISIKTGDPCSFETYEAFYDAFIRQLDFLIDSCTECCNIFQRYYAKEAPQPLRSLLIEGCIEKGLDCKNRGPLYGNGQILAEGIADAADSLAAIKKYVYDEKRFTMAELIDALNKNFEGYDEMYHTLKNSEYKFGNDIAYVDNIAADMVNHFNARLLTIETFRGGHYSGGCSPFTDAPTYGIRTAALPNGKKLGESLFADSIGATPGYDQNGPTALINSCLKFDHTLPGSGFILNVKFDKAIFASKEGEQIFSSLWKSFVERGGQMMTATVVSQEDLLDAQIHPECHQDLIVRVGGFCDQFVNLSPELQENVIKRTGHCRA